MTQAELNAVIENVTKSIADLESYFQHTVIDSAPFVLVLQGTSDYCPAALRAYDGNAYNFSAMGREAAQYSRASADRIAADINANDGMGRKVEIMPKAHFFGLALAAHKRTLSLFEELRAQAA